MSLGGIAGFFLGKNKNQPVKGATVSVSDSDDPNKERVIRNALARLSQAKKA